jgi:hypothetical protein
VVDNLTVKITRGDIKKIILGLKALSSSIGGIEYGRTVLRLIKVGQMLE